MMCSGTHSRTVEYIKMRIWQPQPIADMLCTDIQYLSRGKLRNYLADQDRADSQGVGVRGLAQQASKGRRLAALLALVLGACHVQAPQHLLGLHARHLASCCQQRRGRYLCLQNTIISGG